MHYRHPDYYEVGREKVREYADAVKNDDTAFFEEKAAAELGYDELLATLTFISVFGDQAEKGFMNAVQLVRFGEGGRPAADEVDHADSRRPAQLRRRLWGPEPDPLGRRHRQAGRPGHRDRPRHAHDGPRRWLRDLLG